MRAVSTRLTAAFLCVLPLWGVSVESIGSGTMQERLDQVERVIGSRALMDLLERVDDLQREIRELRGQVEVQAHALSRMQQNQRDHYLDLDERLQQMELATESGKTIPQAFDAPTAEISPTAVSGITGVQGKLVQQEKFANHQPIDYKSTNTQSGGIGSRLDRGQDDAYQEAFNLLKERSYSAAITSLKMFLDQYPHSRYVENAQYWLGESYYITRQFKLALEIFRKFLHKYPTSSKVGDALLKIGYVQDKLGQKTEAEQTLANLIEQYPRSTQAHLARKHLQKIRDKMP
uniref:Cell division coordinator CpoB n=1 Tax=Candidatus Kentrum sp. TUN TaxID=2126343 RepID=A0A450ZQD6_9GAMM|nr:MAG: tol-pal system protein YbgF [Candidatus Kentron sp. TUN]VFK62230.1 MAG: tol-pal system protein YbgF [Candidatus Kentron sp. TUN]